MESIRRLFAI